jgi:hypothetical protein
MKLSFTITIIIASFIFWGCKENEIDNTPPKPPQGIITISLDNCVEINWLPSEADDVEGYNVWVSNQYDGRYQLIGSTGETHFLDNGALNGVTYYYAVSAFDFSHNESELSKEEVRDTPRPEGSAAINDTLTNVNSSGYLFSQNAVLNYNYADFYYVVIGDLYFLEVWNDTDIQDMGYTSSLDEISQSPTDGWAYSHTAEATVGHTYVIWTKDDHYAKVRVTGASGNQLTFDWAYQTAVGNIELKVSRPLGTGGKSRIVPYLNKLK